MPPGTQLRPLLRATHRASPMSTPIAIAAAVAGIGAYAWYRRSNAPNEDQYNLSSFGRYTLRLDSTELVNHNVKRLRFELPDKTKPSGLHVSSAVLTWSWPSGRWLPVMRPYTPTSDLNEPGYLDLMIKLYPTGKQSPHLHALQPGDTLTVMPLQRGRHQPNEHAHLALIAGGAGITPMYQLARQVLSDPADRTRVTLVWGVNVDDDLFLKDEFAEMEKRFPGRFRAVYVVAEPEAGSKYRRGFVTREVLEEAGLGKAAEAERREGSVRVWVCGPPAMEKALKGKGGGVLGELGYSSGQVKAF